MTEEALTAAARRLPDGSHELLAPAVGWYTQAPARGAVLESGQRAGLLLALGRPRAILVPEGVRGRVASEPPRLRRAPVEFGQTLLLLQALEPQGASAESAAPAAAAAEDAMRLRASQAGRFWRRPEPGAAEFLAAGALAEAGQMLGLLEVMKTFQPVRYAAGGGLPARARLLRWRVTDGAEVAEGETLAEFGPA